MQTSFKYLSTSLSYVSSVVVLADVKQKKVKTEELIL